MVEYALITACLAIVGIAGFNALAEAQRGYLANFPVNQAPPTAPGALLHPTSIDPPSCLQNGLPLANPVLLGAPITCTTTVHDTYSNPYERDPPQGTIDWLLDGAQIPSSSPPCNVVALPAVPPYPAADSRCTAPAFTWTPGASPGPTPAALISGSHTLVAKFGRSCLNPPNTCGDPTNELLTSFHLTSSTAPISLTFSANIGWTVACKNEITTETFPLPIHAELGQPVTCTATVNDNNTGTPVPVPNGTAVQWSTVNGGAGPDAGVGIFTCSSPYDIRNDAVNCPQPQLVMSGTASFTCYTVGATGTCAVVYRRIYDSLLGGVGASPTLTLTTALAANPPLLQGSSTYNSIVIIPPAAPHQTMAFIVCQSPDPNMNMPLGAVDNYPTGGFVSPSLGAANFAATRDVDVNGTTATQVTCTITVVDAYSPSPNPNPTETNPCTLPACNSNLDAAYPPMGKVQFTWNGTPSFTSPMCSLVPVQAPGPPTSQALGQVPFMSSCQMGPLTLTGRLASTNPPQQSVSMQPYTGEPVASPGHNGPTVFNYQGNIGVYFDFN
ncbi:MAG TPA: hypothetical protein VKV73_24965 [Chloroflexota bacterium]|nr:hypothetical protein [Chloroflexota bacterium]